MGKIYINQTALVLDFNLGEDITGATVVIQRKNPRGLDIASLSTTIINATKGLVRYISTTTPDFTESGVYTLWAFVTFSDGKTIHGEPCKLQINKIGT